MWSVRDEGEHRGLLTMAGPLVGRDAELAAVLRLLADPVCVPWCSPARHTVAIYRKLGVRGRTEAATWVVRAGLAPAPASDGGSARQ